MLQKFFQNLSYVQTCPCAVEIYIYIFKLVYKEISTSDYFSDQPTLLQQQYTISQWHYQPQPSWLTGMNATETTSLPAQSKSQLFILGFWNCPPYQRTIDKSPKSSTSLFRFQLKEEKGILQRFWDWLKELEPARSKVIVGMKQRVHSHTLYQWLYYCV